MKGYTLRDYILFILLILAVSLYLFIVSVSINRPLQADEVLLAEDAQVPFSSSGIQHSPLYPIVLRLIFQYCRLSGTNLRVFSVICFFINGILIYFLGKKISQSRQAGILSCILFIINPLAVQGSLLLNMDYTILTVFLTAFILYFSACYDSLKLRNCFILGFLFFLSLFSKETTPLVLLPAIALFYWLRRETLFGMTRLLLISLVGLAIFLVVWSVFSYYHKLSFLHFLNYSLSIIKNSGFSMKESLKYFIRILLWFGPSLLLVALLFSRRTTAYLYRRDIGFIDFCLIYITGIIFGYLFVGGNVHQFLRYQYPVLPVIVVILAYFINTLNLIFNKKTIIAIVVLMPLILIYTLFGIGDIIYVFNYSLKDVMVFSPSGLNNALRDFSLRILGYPLLIVFSFSVVRFLNKRWDILRTLSLSVLIVGICANFSLFILQAKADYTTNYYYGRNIKEMRRVGDLFESIKQKYPRNSIIGPGDLIKDVFRSAQMQRDNAALSVVYQDPGRFLKAIENKKVICVAYSISWNSVYTYKNVLLNDNIQKALKNSYRYYKIGTYSLWLKKIIQ